MKKIDEKLKKCLKIIFKKNDIKNINKLKIGSYKEWDSLSHFNLLLQIEKEFKIRFSTNDFSTLITINNISKKIKQKIGK
jgi:acyl carrier protein|tara:strand:- start:147 stop:386 length:240 start_codon:yes stop_codon:yes gene_type:complete